MNEVSRFVTTATIKQSLCDRRDAIRQERWLRDLGRWSKPESVPPIFRQPYKTRDYRKAEDVTGAATTIAEGTNNA
jgi:hypothetical protein